MSTSSSRTVRGYGAHRSRLGTADGDRTEILSGLAPGDTVVTDGVDKLQEGSKVSESGGRPAPAPGGRALVSPRASSFIRPVATSLLMVAILLAGFVAYRQLPVSALPQVDYPTIQVTTFYPGREP